MSRSKVNTATEADWSFTEDEHWMLAVRWAAAKAARQFELVEFDDAEHDAILFVAVRPTWMRQWGREGMSVAELGQRIYANALRPRAVVESDFAEKCEPLESPEDSE